MEFLNDVWICIKGPRLYKIYGSGNSPGFNYKRSTIEFIADTETQLFCWFRCCLKVVSILTLILLPFVINRDNIPFVYNKIIEKEFIWKVIKSIALLVLGHTLFLLGKGISRFRNSQYLSFIRILKRVQPNHNLRLLLNRYDFEFNEWPIDYSWNESQEFDTNKRPQLLAPKQHLQQKTFLLKCISYICGIITYTLAQIIVRRLLYPGTLSLVQYSVRTYITSGRKRLVEVSGGQRYKLMASDGNHIDSMFVKGSHSIKSKTLVICSEGNTGFYEFGIMNTPLKAGYSVLGWNHPGFQWSTGQPFPQNDINAMDVVIHFSVEILKFPIKSIILFSWSIGGFPTTWAAMNYPNVKAVILDATFDHILPVVDGILFLWLRCGSKLIEPLARHLIQEYFNLNNWEQLNHFYGPILLIRRIRDEIISTDPLFPLKSNRGNDLLIKLFDNRFPHLMSDEKTKNALKSWLTNPQKRKEFEIHYKLNETKHLSELEENLYSYSESSGGQPFQYPLQIGNKPQMSSQRKVELILFLAQKHMKDYDSTHCPLLPIRFFEEPFDLFHKKH